MVAKVFLLSCTQSFLKFYLKVINYKSHILSSQIIFKKNKFFFNIYIFFYFLFFFSHLTFSPMYDNLWRSFNTEQFFILVYLFYYDLKHSTPLFFNKGIISPKRKYFTSINHRFINLCRDIKYQMTRDPTWYEKQ